MWNFLHGKILRGIQEFLTTIKHVALALNSRSSSCKERPKSCSIYDLSINNQLFCPTQFILIFVVLKQNKNQGFFNVRSFLLELHIAPLHLNKIHRKQNPTQFICKKVCNMYRASAHKLTTLEKKPPWHHQSDNHG